MADQTRTERDSLGEVLVPADRLWGAQTQRSLEHFRIGDERMPVELFHALALAKKAAAQVNEAEGLLSPEWARLIVTAAEEVLSGKCDAEFPLRVWQSGSGTHSNMNVNEVVSNRANQLAGAPLGGKSPVHPNDHVNMSQSSNDVVPTAMHLATVREVRERLLPGLKALREAIEAKAREWAEVIKIGRTHLQDATPLTVGQEWSGYAAQLDAAGAALLHACEGLYELAAGGTAVGTGLNAPAAFGEKFAARLAALTGVPYVTAPNKFAALGSLDPMVRMSAALRGVAVALMKIAADMRWLGSGPRAGLHELILPENEPGSSIMPGKVNPSQEETVEMVGIQVIGMDTAVAFAGSQGHFELNTLRPLIFRNVFVSARLLGDLCESYRRYGIEGVRLDRERLQRNVEQSLMLVTALTPKIGYDKAAALAHQAFHQNLTLREAALRSGWISAEDFDALTAPERMIGAG
jgi:fumarate hydratase class II